MSDIITTSSKEYIDKLISSIPSKPIGERITYRGYSILVTMPCWNEEGKIGPGVQAVPKDLVDTTCVVDNGSFDNTRTEAQDAGALVISHPINLGAGGGIRTGLEFGYQNKFDFLAVLAGDNQDEPKDLYRAADKLIDEELDYVQGSRWVDEGKRENMTLSRTILTWLYSLLFRILFRTKITDATNGFRIFRREILENPNLNLWQNWLLQYEMEPYLLIQTCRSGYKVGEVPVTKRYHNDMKDNTKMVPFKSWWSILRPLFLISLKLKK
ncbi:MAG: glycosyltransferase family 2 protein [Opitutae bacterium]